MIRAGLALLALVFSVAGLWAQGEQADPQAPIILVTPVEGAIGPPATRHIASVIERAETRGAALVVLRMDTPGGLATSTRDINRAILSARVPVAVHVAPAGTRAASAGTYILYAAHVAAMAEGTNLGAATPVAMGGGAPLPQGGEAPRDEGSGEEGEAPPSPEDAGAQKRIEDAVASIRALAELRGRNADWAEKAVREAASLTAREALERGVIEHLAADTAALAAAADGRTVSVNGTERRLALGDPRIETVAPSLVTRILSVLANPNVALLMMTLGFYGLLYELASPGLGPGVAGAILMLLGLYSLNTLPVNYAGMGLILLGLLLLGLEALSPSFGVAGIGGIVAFGIGAAILIDTDVAAFQVSPGVIVTLGALSGAVVLLLVGAVVGTRRQRPRESAGEMAGAMAEVLSWEDGKGRVRAHGELWRATGPAGLSPGDTARVDSVEGLTLHLRRADGADRKDQS
ncbi:nodulation protein NfeD [Rhodosalinus halophilus]|uniref:Nodulation protein NfeD n=2 Tax=Rhodosalinus halophilus TaxID=2259333 RepID=A0A365U753_9RHOB|nr:nodulation protein NfeD [Rhodosalinus halophilus]